MERITLYHGSTQIIEHPSLEKGRMQNDYGRGFYCTKDLHLAGDWACKTDRDGFINQYEMDLSGLKMLDLNDETHTVLNWIAVLLKNRTFDLDSPVAERARDYLIDHFAVDTEAVDIVCGYRADDSYFRFAESFVENGLPLRGLDQALRLGKLGHQIVLTSREAFRHIEFKDAFPASRLEYYPKLYQRDQKARMKYREEIAGKAFFREDIFVLDIIREEMKNDDPRIQRLLSE